MKKKTHFAGIGEQNAQETFRLFAPFIPEAEKEQFKALVEKAENSNKLQDRKELYYAIGKALNHYNFNQYKDDESSLTYHQDGFNSHVQYSTQEINWIMDCYARGATDVNTNAAIAKHLAEKFDMAIEIAKNIKQKVTEKFDAFKNDITEETGLLADKNWRNEYFAWQGRHAYEMSEIEDDYTKRCKFSEFDFDLGDILCPQNLFDAIVIKPLIWLPTTILYGVAQLYLKTVEAPSVLNARHSKKKTEIPATRKSFEQIKQALPILAKSFNIQGQALHSDIDRYTPKQLLEQFQQALPEMDEQIEYLEQAKAKILTKYKTQTEAEIRNAPKKSTFIMSRKATHLAKEFLTQTEIDSGICELPPESEGFERHRAKERLGLDPNLATDKQLFRI